MTELNAATFDSARTALGIEQVIKKMINEKTLIHSEKLPSIRALAKLLAVSPATVASAYTKLEKQGLVESNGRKGTQISARNLDPHRGRVFQMRLSPPGKHALDLSTGFPDLGLIPQTNPSIHSKIFQPNEQNFFNRSLSEDLAPPLDLLFGPNEGKITVTNGALDALDRILHLTVAPGDIVAVEEPSFPAILDLLDAHKAIAAPLSLDDSGIDPQKLEQLLSKRIKALIVQPRSQNPTGISTSPSRLKELVGVLETRPPVLIIEDDHSGLISQAPRITFADFFPDRTITILGFSKSHGPDLRIAGVRGPKQIINALDARRRLGPAWTSEIIQRILAFHLANQASIDLVSRAREIYHRRLDVFVSGLDDVGIHTSSRDGLNVWVPTSSTSGLITDLARNSIVVSPGNPFFIKFENDNFVRVTTSCQDDYPEAFFDLLARWAI